MSTKITVALITSILVGLAIFATDQIGRGIFAFLGLFFFGIFIYIIINEKKSY